MLNKILDVRLSSQCARSGGWFAAGLLLSFVIASATMSGWSGLVSPDLAHPFVYAGDGLSHLWFTQRVIEGWVFANSRSGFPFGSSFLDYPGSDAANFLILKFLGASSGSYYAAANLYFLLSFPVAFASTFVVCRRLEMRNDTSFACAMLFTLLSFHFFRLRMGHLFYTWYFTVPVYFYIGYGCLKYPRAAVSRTKNCLLFLALVVLSSFGVYFAFFGLLIIGLLALLSFAQHRNWQTFIKPFWASAAISTGVFLNVLPNIINTWRRGVNPEVAQRLPVESEMYALKLTHLLVPHPLHKIQALGDFGASYASTFPLTNTVSYVGIVGIVGLMLVFSHIFQMAANQSVEPIHRRLSLLIVALLLISTVGGLNVFFAMFVSPAIRGWDRIGVFLGFLVLLAFFISIDRVLIARRTGRVASSLVLGAVLVVGVLDQTPRIGANEAISSKRRFDMDREFIGRIESSLPPSAAIYQMPYIPFPESGPVHRMHSYDQLVGFLNSKQLRWSGGGMAGRPGDLFYRELATKPLEEQLATARAIGFSGIYIDKNGYEDHGAAVIENLTKFLGRGPIINRADGNAAFFSII